ncbi:MAG: hypothetical protein ACLVHV_02945 [Oscillospiraceae bacterium]
MFTVNGKELDYDIFDADKADLIQRVMEETFKKSLPLTQILRKTPGRVL